MMDFSFSAGGSSERKNFDEESNASLSIARDETRDYFGVDDIEPSASQMFDDRAMFSFWPKVSTGLNSMNISDQLNPSKCYKQLFEKKFS